MLADRQTWGPTALQRRSMTDHVAGPLRAVIVSGRIGPDQPLRKTALSRALGTGRSAIREDAPVR